AYFDLFPDGRVTPNSTLGYHFEPSVLFPRLPKDAQEAQRGWEGIDTSQESHTAFKTGPGAAAEPDSYAFTGVGESPMDRIYLSSSQATYRFDRKQGVIRRIA